MKNQIIRLNEKDKKVFGYSDTQLIFSSKGHKTFESLESAAIKPGMLETLKVINMESVKGIEYNESEEGFTVIYDKKGKNKKVGIGINDKSLRQNVVEEMASINGFTQSIEEESKNKYLLYNLFLVAITAVCTYVFRGMAIDAQHGEHYVATGRRRGLAQLLGNTVESIGPLWVTLIGLVILLYFCYKAYTRYSNPAREFKYN